MNLTFTGKQITGFVTVIPKNVASFSDEIPNYAFPPASSRKLQKLLGLETHRYLADESVTGSDLALHGIRHLIGRSLLRPEDIDALLYVTQTPDYFIPPTSNVMQGALGLKHDAICMDINQGCAGFLLGLLQAFMLLDLEGVRKVVLVNADTASKQTNHRDRNTFPLVGDAATVTIVERSSPAEAADPIRMSLKMDGSRWQALHIPAGAYRTRSTPETSAVQDLGNGNFRSLEHIHMDGNAIFNFTMTEVPEMITDILAWSGRSKAEIEYFMFHQPNKFILERLADLLEIPREKMPNKTSTIYGNTSSCSIPHTICDTLSSRMLAQSYLMCLAGFGVGLTWGAMVLRMGPLQICEVIEF
jgi:3-oxoacyl-[acyl-carrier-protein] synthase-3